MFPSNTTSPPTIAAIATATMSAFDTGFGRSSQSGDAAATEAPASHHGACQVATAAIDASHARAITTSAIARGRYTTADSPATYTKRGRLARPLFAMADADG